MDFEWDEYNLGEIRRHRVAWDEAEQVFDDPRAIEVDASDMEDEVRYGIMGLTNEGRAVTVIFTERDGRIRVITARPASRREEEEYWSR